MHAGGRTGPVHSMTFVRRAVVEDRWNGTVKMLALAFLLPIGAGLVAEGLDAGRPKGYAYGPIAFAILVEVLNLRYQAVAADLEPPNRDPCGAATPTPGLRRKATPSTVELAPPLGAAPVTEWVFGLFDALGAAGLVLPDNFFPPIPSEVVLPLGGFRARADAIDPVWVWPAATAGAVAGSLVVSASGCGWAGSAW